MGEMLTANAYPGSRPNGEALTALVFNKIAKMTEAIGNNLVVASTRFFSKFSLFSSFLAIDLVIDLVFV